MSRYCTFCRRRADPNLRDDHPPMCRTHAAVSVERFDDIHAQHSLCSLTIAELRIARYIPRVVVSWFKIPMAHAQDVKDTALHHVVTGMYIPAVNGSTWHTLSISREISRLTRIPQRTLVPVIAGIRLAHDQRRYTGYKGLLQAIADVSVDLRRVVQVQLSDGNHLYLDHGRLQVRWSDEPRRRTFTCADAQAAVTAGQLGAQFSYMVAAGAWHGDTCRCQAGKANVASWA